MNLHMAKAYPFTAEDWMPRGSYIWKKRAETRELAESKSYELFEPKK